MLSKNQIKYIRSLHAGKFRQIHSQYIVEGAKMIEELVNTDKQIAAIYALTDFIEKNLTLLQSRNISFETIDDDELQKISALTTPNKALAIVIQDKYKWGENNTLDEGLFLALENIQDPGNLGTIIRSADWFGVKAIFCSEHSVDAYNPKVVQSSMGSLFRIPVYYTGLKKLLQHNKDIPAYAAVLAGKNVYECALKKNALLVIGNESKGISDELIDLCSEKISIPNFGKAESLNAAIACSVLLGLWRK
jgi:RNA methyltransferase, TrmH family